MQGVTVMPPPVHVPPPASAVRGSSRAHWAWAFALVAIVAMLIGGGLIYLLAHGAFTAANNLLSVPERALSGVAAAFRPNVQVTTQLNTAIGALKNNPKLVVLTTDIDAEVVKSSSTNWGYVYWGTTEVSLRAHGNRIQYFVPVDSLGTADFQFDPAHKRLTLYVPPPVLDEQVVDVQSDPSKIDVRTDLGWAKFDRWSGAPLRSEAQRDLRQAVLSAGRHELLSDKARNNARTQIRRMLEPMADALQPEVELDVQFKEPPTPRP